MVTASSEGEIWRMLDVILFTPPVRAGASHGTRTDTPPLSEFSPMWLLSEKASGSDAWYFGPEQVNRPDLIWPIDFCALADRRDYQDASLGWGEEEVASAVKVQSISPKLIRGKSSKVYSHNVKVSIATILRGSYLTCDGFFGWCNGKWVDAFPDKKHWAYRKNKPVLEPSRQTFDAVVDRCVKMTQTAALRARYSWTVSFSIYGGPQIRLETDPRGIKALFKTREKDSDSGRRAALRNWISDHWRRRETEDGEALSYVRNHLRGRTEFKWNGFDCVVEPSQYDLEKNTTLGQMRSDGASVSEMRLAYAS